MENQTQAMAKRDETQVRMEDVAKLADVSVITVSRALKQPRKVAERTRAKIMKAVEETGYIPNLVAGGLASHRTSVVGAVIPTITNSIFADTIHGMSDVFGAAGMQLLLGTTGYSLAREEELVAAMLGQRASALILTGATHSKRARPYLERPRIPGVEPGVIDGHPIDLRVGFSNFDASHAMVRHLAACGYRRIGFVSAPIKANDRAEARLRGYRRAVQDLGLVDKRSYERQAAFSFRQGAEVFVDLIESEPALEAVYFANDILAIGALLEARRLCIAVPGHIAVAGFDAVHVASQGNPGLTTTRLPPSQTRRPAADQPGAQARRHRGREQRRGGVYDDLRPAHRGT